MGSFGIGEVIKRTVDELTEHVKATMNRVEKAWEMGECYVMSTVREELQGEEWGTVGCFAWEKFGVSVRPA